MAFDRLESIPQSHAAGSDTIARTYDGGEVSMYGEITPTAREQRSVVVELVSSDDEVEWKVADEEEEAKEETTATFIQERVSYQYEEDKDDVYEEKDKRRYELYKRDRSSITQHNDPPIRRRRRYNDKQEIVDFT